MGFGLVSGLVVPFSRWPKLRNRHVILTTTLYAIFIESIFKPSLHLDTWQPLGNDNC